MLHIVLYGNLCRVSREKDCGCFIEDFSVGWDVHRHLDMILCRTLYGSLYRILYRIIDWIFYRILDRILYRILCGYGTVPGVCAETRYQQPYRIRFSIRYSEGFSVGVSVGVSV